MKTYKTGFRKLFAAATVVPILKPLAMMSVDWKLLKYSMSTNVWYGAQHRKKVTMSAVIILNGLLDFAICEALSLRMMTV